MRDALVWEDEWTKELSSEGFEKLCQLWVARSLDKEDLKIRFWLHPDIQKHSVNYNYYR